MERDQQFLEYVVKALADHPEDVQITRTIDEMGVLLTLSVNREDMGKIIGRSGATAKAIRTILRVVGMKNDARVNLKIEEPQGSELSDSSREPMPQIGDANADDSIDDVIADLKN